MEIMKPTTTPEGLLIQVVGTEGTEELTKRINLNRYFSEEFGYLMRVLVAVGSEPGGGL